VGQRTPIQEVAEHGQSIWYDNLHRPLYTSGELGTMIEHDGLLGMTSNPTIFEKAIAGSDAYDADIRKMDPSLDDVAVFERLAIADIQAACDLFRPVFDRTHGGDGYVSLEVSPHVAHDTEKTIADAKRLYAAVHRPNVMIKVPGTPEGIVAIRHLIGTGINITTTLLFAVDAYLQTADAYLGGLEDFKAKGGDLSKVAGVASFCLSRIDTAVDGKLPEGHELRGKTAIANAKIAYERYEQLIASARWKALAAAGAKPQRLLWASTGTKNPAYPKLHYVVTLVGRDTVNTVPTETYNAIKEHTGGFSDTLAQDYAGAHRTIEAVEKAGISMRAVTDKLLVDGVAAFAKSFDTLLPTVAKKRAAVGAK